MEREYLGSISNKGKKTRELMKGKFLIFDSLRVRESESESEDLEGAGVNREMKYNQYGEIKSLLYFKDSWETYITYENVQQAAIAFLALSELFPKIKVGYRLQTICKGHLEGKCLHENRHLPCGFLHQQPSRYKYIPNVSTHLLAVNPDPTPFLLNTMDSTDWLYRNKGNNKFYRKAVLLSKLKATQLDATKFVKSLQGTPIKNKLISQFPPPATIYHKILTILKHSPYKYNEEAEDALLLPREKKSKIIPGLGSLNKSKGSQKSKDSGENTIFSSETKVKGAKKAEKLEEVKVGEEYKASKGRKIENKLTNNCYSEGDDGIVEATLFYQHDMGEGKCCKLDNQQSREEHRDIDEEFMNTRSTEVSEKHINFVPKGGLSNPVITSHEQFCPEDYTKVWAYLHHGEGKFIQGERKQEKIELELDNTLGGTEIDNERFVCTGVLNTGRRVAIKALKKELHKEITNELQLLVLLDSHPNIIRYFDKFAIYRKSVVGVKYPIEYYVIPIELCAGSIADYITYVGNSMGNSPKSTISNSHLALRGHELSSIIPSPTYDPIFIKSLMKDALKGIIFLHSTGRDKQPVIHRDIKPQNILITYDKQAKISDFGISRAKITDKTIKGEGTYKYMAPEIWKEPTRLSQAADIFALGATFYYMMVGHHLFQEAAYILSKEEYEFSGLLTSKYWKKESSEAISLLRQMLSKDPAIRPLPKVILQNIFFCTDTVIILQKLKEINDHIILAQLTKELDKICAFPSWKEDLKIFLEKDPNAQQNIPFYHPTDSDLLKFIRNKFCHITELRVKEREILRVSKAASQRELYIAFLEFVRTRCEGLVSRYFEFYRESESAKNSRLTPILAHRAHFARNPTAGLWESCRPLDIPIWTMGKNIVGVNENSLQGVVFENESLKVSANVKFMREGEGEQGVCIGIWVNNPEYIPSNFQLISPGVEVVERHTGSSKQRETFNLALSSISPIPPIVRVLLFPQDSPITSHSISFPLPIYVNRFMRPHSDIRNLNAFEESWRSLDKAGNEVLDVLLDLSMLGTQWRETSHTIIKYWGITSFLDNTDRNLLNLAGEVLLMQEGVRRSFECLSQIEDYQHHVRVSVRSRNSHSSSSVHSLASQVAAIHIYSLTSIK